MAMRTVALSDAELKYLADASYLPEGIDTTTKSLEGSTGRGGMLTVSAAEAEHLRSLFTERLAEVGFDENYELTPEGSMLEALIDRFYCGGT
jgi:hypothetical protein